MRIANLAGRLVVLTGPQEEPAAHDVARHSGGRFGPDPQSVYDHWGAFTAWARDVSWREVEPVEPVDATRLGSPAPAPRQVFAIGLNYREHAAEAGFVPPTAEPPVFTKFPSCIVGPRGHIELPAGGHVDWEVELVVVIGRHTHRVRAEHALDHVAGYAVGQDVSERVLQMAAQPPQFSLAKSLPGFGPVGPWLVTPDELLDADDVAIGCAINGEVVQDGRTTDLIHPVRELIARLSASTVLLPGDVIFTGTPAGVGMGRTPPRWLQAGDELVSWADGIGELRHRFIASR